MSDGHSSRRTTLENPSPMSRTLLVCGVVAGPLYVAVTLIEALTREGFDLTRHRFTLLTTGDLGWVHQLNMIVVGLLTILFAIGVRRTLREGRGALCGPWIVALFGAAYLFGGLFTADPVTGFPPGTLADLPKPSLNASLQNASRGVSTLLLLLVSLVFASRFAGEGRRNFALLYGTSVPLLFASLVAAGFAIGVKSGGLAFLMAPWIWTSGLAFHLYLSSVASYSISNGR